jgi:eukaryotic-like serine/threonine-protein kinase
VSHYRVLSELGRGGMGIVYEGEDTLLGRRAALKFLPDDVAHEPQVLARFQREARSASSLNHPNICTIYEIGEQDQRWFIAMELLEGMPLDSALAGARVSPDKVLDWAIQIADALDAAHNRGIVHRDLKPSNIFITKRGPLKVLDFGLAKMAEPAIDGAALTSPATATFASPLTSPGTALGTVAFMSPEQARGDNLDARSDLFSFGTVLYQMATGRLPFDGKTAAIIFDAILNREAIPISDVCPDVPAELQRIVAKCLEKDPDLRYQHASELRADLKRLKRDSGSAARSKSAPATSNSGRSSGALAPEAFPSASEPISSKATGRSLSGSELVATASKHRVGFALTTLLAIVLLAAATFGIYELLHRPAHIPFQNMAITAITSDGDTWAAAISPDGKYVATLRREHDGRDSLWMRHLPTNSNTQIVPPGDSAVLDITFGPDGNYVYFRSHSAGQSITELNRVPVLGGTIARVSHDVDSAPAFSAGAERFCFLRYNQAAHSQTLLSAKPDGSDEKVILSEDHITYSNPAWSPDGKRIALAEALQGVRRESHRSIRPMDMLRPWQLSPILSLKSVIFRGCPMGAAL